MASIPKYLLPKSREIFFCFLTKIIFSVEKPLFSGADSGGKNGLVL